MFQPRQLFHRPGTSTTRTTDPRGKVEDHSGQDDRHPAMRGLKVSPVHGRHCICGRCERHPDAA